jgi:hypothetical protein
LVIVKLNWQSITAAAQPVDVGVSGGGVAQQVTSLPASLPVGANGGVNLGDGYEMPDNTALTALPGGAGPAVQFEIEYYVKITVLP